MNPVRLVRRVQEMPGPVFAWLLITPMLLFFLIWNIFPLVWMIGLSFFKFNITFGMPPRFVGISNYVHLMNDYSFWRHLSLTFVFVILAVSIETLLGACIGFVIWRNTRVWGRRLALTLLFSPMMLAPVAVGTFFKLNYSPSYGVIPYLLHVLLGIPGANPLGNGAVALYAVLGVDVWMWTPFLVLMTIAALGAVPEALLESARIDRLRFHRVLRYIVWPHAKFILLLGVLLRTIDAFKTFDLVSSMTAGGPGTATLLAPLSIYREGFTSFNMGVASTMAIFVLFIAIALTSIYIYVLSARRTADVEG